MINVSKTGNTKSFSETQFMVHRIEWIRNILCYFPRISSIRLQLHGAIYRPDFFVLMLHHCVNLKAIRYESMSLNRIAADKSHRVIVA